MTNAFLLAIEIGMDPTLVEIGSIEITWHGLFTALGVVAGVAIAVVLGKRAGYSEDTVYNVALALVVGGIIGARALYVIENFDEFENDLGNIVAINTGGISIYGALIGGGIGAWLYAIIAKVPNIPRGADIGAIAATVGMAIGRIGDVINGEHFAKTTDLPWGIIYTHPNSPSFLRFGPEAEPQHPAVAYELIGDLFIFVILMFIYYKVPRAGVTFFAWVFLYGLLRFLVSFLRLDNDIIAGLTAAQVIALIAMPIGLGGIIYLLRTPPAEERRADRRRREEPGDEEPPPPAEQIEEPTAG
jgi:phosphatidylglycerol:prolipoprotein diacylglycerol transferase